MFSGSHDSADHAVSRRRRSTPTRSSGWSSSRSPTAPPALVPCGSTGESATLTHAGARRGRAPGGASCAKGRVPVIAGTGSNSTAEAIAPDPGRQGGGRRRGAADLALLQQADAGRHLPALQGHRRGHALPADRLQHPRAHRLEDRGDDDRAAGRARAHRRPQGSDRLARRGAGSDPPLRRRARGLLAATTRSPCRSWRSAAPA